MPFDMTGSIILTGANGSVALHATKHLLKNYPSHTAIFTVRDASDSDVNTQQLRAIVSRSPQARVHIHQLDLASLHDTHAFCDLVTSGIASGQYPPIAAIICNAYYWNLVGDPELTVDSYDKTLQVNHISHAALVLRLLGQFGNGGRVFLISSDSHWQKSHGEVSAVYPC